MKKIKVKDVELDKAQRAVRRRFPNAAVQCVYVDPEDFNTKHFAVCDQDGVSVVDPELLIPPATTIRSAWINASYCGWFSNMIRKSNAAFSDEKIFRGFMRDCEAS